MNKLFFVLCATASFACVQSVDAARTPKPCGPGVTGVKCVDLGEYTTCQAACDKKHKFVKKVAQDCYKKYCQKGYTEAKKKR